MKILIAYSSVTGNTKKLCNALYENLKDKHEVTIQTIKETKEFESYDVIVPGFWVDKGSANREAKKFIKQIKNKKIVPIGTLGAAPDSYHGQKCLKKITALIDESNETPGVFLSRGKVNPKLTAKIHKLPLPKKIRDQMYEASVASREPNETDFKNATEFVEQILS